MAVYLRAHGDEHNPNTGEYHGNGNTTHNNPEGGDASIIQQPSKFPLREAIRKENLPALISATLTPMLGGASYYVTFVWMAIYMETLIDPAIKHAFWINAMALLFGVTVPMPLIGMLSDHCGRVPIMVTGAIGLATLGPLMLLAISTGNEVKAFFAQLVVGLCLTLYGAPTVSFLVEMFPPKMRLTSVAVGYDLAQSSASAFSPLAATMLLQKYGPKGPGMIYPFFAVLSLIGIMMGTAIHRIGGVENDSGNSSPSSMGNNNNAEIAEEATEEPKLNPIV